MWGTSSPGRKLTGDLGNVIEVIKIGDRRSAVGSSYGGKIITRQFRTFATISARLGRLYRFRLGPLIGSHRTGSALAPKGSLLTHCGLRRIEIFAVQMNHSTVWGFYNVARERQSQCWTSPSKARRAPQGACGAYFCRSTATQLGRPGMTANRRLTFSAFVLSALSCCEPGRRRYGQAPARESRATAALM